MSDEEGDDERSNKDNTGFDQGLLSVSSVQTTDASEFASIIALESVAGTLLQHHHQRRPSTAPQHVLTCKGEGD
mgnify:CR=1 FL=1